MGAVFYRDHGWGTWARLRETPASLGEVAVGKLLPLASLFATQQVVLMLTGVLFCGMRWRGSAPEGFCVLTGIVAIEISTGLVVAGFCKTINQVNVSGTVTGMVLAGLGGALAPVRTLPFGLAAVAELSPVYWAMDGLHNVIGTGMRPERLWEDLLVMGAFAVVLTCLAFTRLRFDATKQFYA